MLLQTQSGEFMFSVVDIRIKTTGNNEKYLKTRDVDIFLVIYRYLFNTLYILFKTSLPSEWMNAYQEAY